MDASGFVTGAIVGKLLLDTKQWSASIAGVAADQKKVKGWGDQISGAFKVASRVITGAATIAAATIGGMVLRTVKLGDEIAKLSKKTGISAETLSSFRLAADHGGASIETLAVGLRTLARSMDEAVTNKGSKAAKVFEELGIKVTDDTGKFRKLDDVLYDLADWIAKTDDSTRKLVVSQELLGRAGMSLIPVFEGGSEGLKREREEAERLGQVFSKEDAVACEYLQDRLTDLKKQFEGIGVHIAMTFIPTLGQLAKKLSESIDVRAVAKTVAVTVVDIVRVMGMSVFGLTQIFQGLKASLFAIMEFLTGALIRWTKIVLAVNSLTKVLGGPFKKEHQDLLDRLKFLTELQDEFNKLKEGEIDVMTDANVIYEGFLKLLDEIKIAAINAEPAVKAVGKAAKEIIVPTPLPPGRTPVPLPEGKPEEGVKAYENQWKESYYNIIRWGQYFNSEMDKIFSGLYNNQMMRLEAEYNVRRQAIEDNITDEGARSAAINSLDEEMSRRKLDIMRKEAKAQKLSAVFSIIVNTASAIVEALPNIVLAVFVGALGAAQLAITLATPLPSYGVGGRVEETGPAIVHRGEYITPAAEAGGARVQLVFAPVFNISTLDPMTTRDVVREKIGPELLDMLNARLLQSEFRRALGVRT
jgi:hypothetical protein